MLFPDEAQELATQDKIRDIKPGPCGIFHPDCYTLSQLHSDAVDYPKVGVREGHPINVINPAISRASPSLLTPSQGR